MLQVRSLTVRAVCASALVAFLLAGRPGWSGEPALSPLRGPLRRGKLAEFRVAGVERYENPFDPSVVSVDAECVWPSGAKWTVPAFFITPFKGEEPPEEPRIVTHMRVFFTTKDWRDKDRLVLLLDDLTLVDTDTGERVVLDDFEGPHAWQPQQADVAVETRRPHGGKQSLRLSLTVDKKDRWPGMGRKVESADWSRFEELRAWVNPVEGLSENVPVIEYYTRTRRKFQSRLRALEGAKAGEWREFIWKLPSNLPRTVWRPAGEPQWRVRLRPQEAGTVRCRVHIKDAKGTRTGAWQAFRVADGDTDGYLRASPKDPRYLAFDSGKPYFAIGINLLGSDLPTYRYYIAKLAAQKANFIRIWLSPRTMGIETKDSGPRRYAQDRAASLDALFDLCAANGIYVMACITDFREVDSRHDNSDWKNSPYNAANGGPCRRAEEFFTSEEAKEQYRAKLRYLVARYGHSPHVHSWEFFNEVSITDGWRMAPDSVRAWHKEMAAYLRRVDPQHHLITSSFAGLEDDALWEQPLMEVVQRHQYIGGELSFAPLVAEAHRRLRRHGKPVLMGEFGRRKNRYASLDSQGVSLHNGLWSAVLSGGCGTAMSWWWRWIDMHDIWPQFHTVATFVERIDWPAEGFQPSGEAVVTAEPDPEHGFGPASFAPVAGGFQPGPANRPMTLRVNRAGELNTPDTLPRFLHGLRNHPDLHNPVTFHVNFSQAGHFELRVKGVSGYGGAKLELLLDGKPVKTEDFADTFEDNMMLTQYDGPHGIPIPAGKHTVTVRNTGKDWIQVTRYAFSGARHTPPIVVMSLRGKRTTFVWVWNESHAWYRPVVNTPLLKLRDVVVTLKGLKPGRVRVRRFDTWAGSWGVERTMRIGADGTARLRVGELTSDVAFRLERRARR